MENKTMMSESLTQVTQELSRWSAGDCWDKHWSPGDWENSVIAGYMIRLEAPGVAQDCGVTANLLVWEIKTLDGRHVSDNRSCPSACVSDARKGVISYLKEHLLKEWISYLENCTLGDNTCK